MARKYEKTAVLGALEREVSDEEKEDVFIAVYSFFDGQKENGELATYKDFVSHIGNLSDGHLAEIRALYIEGGQTERGRTIYAWNSDGS